MKAIRIGLLACLALSATLLQTHAAPGDVDASFDPGSTINSVVNVMTLQGEGKVLIGGRFTTIHGAMRGSLARLNADGSPDASFVANVSGHPVGYGQSVNAVCLQSDGKLIIGGAFTSVNGVVRSNLARLNTDGSLDTSFPGGSAGPVARLMGEYSPPIIVKQPRSQTAETGSSVQFAVRATSESLLAYQWFFNSALLIGAADSVLQRSAVQFSDSGAYHVRVFNGSGAVTSSPAMLSVIAPVERRPVPAVRLEGQPATVFDLEYTTAITASPAWLVLATINMTNSSQWYFDLAAPISDRRFYRLSTDPIIPRSLQLHVVPAITVTGSIGNSVRLDYINAVGPTDAWLTLTDISLTNTSQLFFDLSSIGQPRRLYRLIQLP